MRDFDATVKAYSGWLRYHADQRCRNGVIDPEEVMQETWIEVWRNWPTINAMEKRGGILMHIMHQSATKLWRLTQAHSRRGVRVQLEDWNAGGAMGNQEDAVHLAEAEQAIATLPGWTPDAMRRVAIGDQFSEIAADYGVSRQAVECRVSRGRERLRQLTG